MNFDFTEDQKLFAETVNDFFSKECTPEAVRKAWDSEDGLDRDRWTALAEMGVVGLLMPEAHGGLGMSEIDAVLLLEESGKAALPEPIVDTAFVAGPLLSSVGPPDFVDEWIPKVADGSVLLSVQKGGRPFITDAHIADLVVLVHKGEVYAVPPSELTLEPQISVDRSRRLFAVDWHRDPQHLICHGEIGRAAVFRGFNRGALGVSAQMLGLADSMIKMTVEYVSERQQFGQPIGSFQAIKHQLANALLKLEFARPVVYRAAYSMANDSTNASRDVSMAKTAAGEAAHLVGRVALQCHGAIGYTVEHDLQLFMKRAWALESQWGTTRWHRERVATAVLGSPDRRAIVQDEEPLLGESLG